MRFTVKFTINALRDSEQNFPDVEKFMEELEEEIANIELTGPIEIFDIRIDVKE